MTCFDKEIKKNKCMHHNLFVKLLLEIRKKEKKSFTVLALTVKIRKSQDSLAPISGNPGDQIFFTHFQKFNLNILKLLFME